MTLKEWSDYLIWARQQRAWASVRERKARKRRDRKPAPTWLSAVVKAVLVTAGGFALGWLLAGAWLW